MAQPILRVGHIGAVIRGTIVENGATVDVSTATTLKLKLEKPTSAVLVKDVDFTTNGTDGQVEYETEPGDLDVQGDWRGQFYLEFGSLQKFHTDIFKLQVGGNLS